MRDKSRTLASNAREASSSRSLVSRKAEYKGSVERAGEEYCRQKFVVDDKEVQESTNKKANWLYINGSRVKRRDKGL